MKIRIIRASIALAVGILTLAGCRGEVATPAQAQMARSRSAGVPAPKVVIFAIDGPRYSETFGDPAHTHIPRIWNDLRPQGTIITNFQNQGETKTVPGHCTILTGTWQTIANDGTERPNKPTLFEYYRQWLSAPASDTHVIAGKAKLDVCSYSTHPDYGAAYAASENAGLATDPAVYNALITTLQTQQPRLVLACFPGVDIAGHSGVWNDYVAAIAGVDSLAYKTWDYLQSDPFYAGQTYMIITNDHGRHDDAHGGFTNHGDGCPGCSHLNFLALGPDIRAGQTLDLFFTQRDICKTVGDILELPLPYAEGHIIQDIFEFVPVGIE